ncbi:MAG: lipoate--protein ligase family protein [Gemmatimonadota bacterium]
MKPGSAWRFIDTGHRDGAWNMAVDEVLLEEAATGGPPVVRVYGWSPPAVTLGYGQRSHHELDQGACRRAGVEVVRRLTGGRAVLHWSELTYSVICAETEERLAGTVEESHRRIAACLAAGMRSLGVAVDLERGAPRRREAAAVSPGVPTAVHEPCFTSTARWEVKWHGRKLIGSAQRRVRGGLLQHGSVLTGPEHRRLLELLSGPPLPGAAAALEANSTDLAECLGRPVAFEEVASHLAAGFRRTLGIGLEAGPLTAAEETRAEQLAVSRYRDPVFTAGPPGSTLRLGAAPS